MSCKYQTSWIKSKHFVLGLSRTVGGGGKISQLGPAPLPQSLSPHLPLERTETPSHTLSVLDFSSLNKQSPASSVLGTGLTGHKKKRKKTHAVPRGVTKEEYFSRLENF